MDNNFSIREYRPQDFDAVTVVWRISREKSLPQFFNNEKSHFFYEDQDYFRHHILVENDVWVVDMKNRPIAFMAIRNDFIDHLYVHPDYQHRGVGKALLEHARSLSPDHLWLYTLQVNEQARAFTRDTVSWRRNLASALRPKMSPMWNIIGEKPEPLL